MKTSHDGRLIAIGDVHGCIHALDALLEAINPARDDQLIFLGDLVDQGANTREVLDRIVELHQVARVVPPRRGARPDRRRGIPTTRRLVRLICRRLEGAVEGPLKKWRAARESARLWPRDSR